MKIDVVGSGSAYSLTRNTSSILVTDNHVQRWLIDCGPTVPRALWQRGLDVNDVDVLYFTHIHPDHCAGLPALLNRWKSFGRHKPLIIYCQAPQREILQQLVSMATWPVPEICFDIDWRDSQPQWQWQQWRLFTAATQHEMSNLSLRIEVDGQALFYSGDGRPTEASCALMQGCDLAFQECAVSQPLPKESSHGDVVSCLALQQSLSLPALGLYHCFDEEISNIKSIISGHPQVFLSYDGLTLDLDLGIAVAKLI